MAKLMFKYSTMNAGKTMDLIRTVYNYKENDRDIILMKPLIDTKGNSKIETRAGLSMECDILIPENTSILKLLVGKLDDVKCIFIDEAEFLNSRQIDDLFIVAHVLDIPVICYGLRDDFTLHAFEGSSRLWECADTFEEFKTLCRCGQTARFCGRKVDGEYVRDGETIVIDGTDNVEYVPLCGDCYARDVLKLDQEKIKKLIKMK